jgi:uncharacterized membrane protein YhiD involved in acid resistance
MSAPILARIRRLPVRLARGVLPILLVVAASAGPAFAALSQLPVEESAQGAIPPEPHPMQDIYSALVRLPVAAVLGAALALRPKRRGTPARNPAVIQTQIMLAVVGAVIMLVVGASLARAFGIVGAANLIRYRSKIEDPKDAVVMLCALAVGLASGVGLFALGGFATVFMVAALWVIESFEPEKRKHFSLTVRAGADTDGLKPRLESILTRFDCDFELRTSSDEEVCYDVKVPLELQTDLVSEAILQLDPEGHAAVEWSDKPKKK